MALATPATSRLVGRRAELEWLRTQAEQPGLVVIKGPAGVGKTRLAREIVSSVPGIGCFCDLTEARSAADVCHALASLLGLDASGTPQDAPALAALGRALRARGRTVLVADNFEQIASAASGILGALVDAAPELTVIVTSRERLGLVDELCFELSPLAPDDAVALFHDRAGRVRAGYAQTPASDEAIARLVRALDGLPLAIELAASRVAVLTPAEILTRLGERLDLLRAQRRDDPARHHRTLREAIAWSWQLLGSDEQATFATCAAFRGGFGLDAASGVLGPDHLLDRLQALCDRSLLWAGPAPGLEAESRFEMYESLRSFAAERLAASGRAREVERRHARVIVDLARRAAALSCGPDGSTWRRRLALERQNLEAVVDRACGAEDLDAEGFHLAALALGALEPVVDVAGGWGDLVERASSLLRRATPIDAEAARPRALVRLCLARGLTRAGRVAEGIAELRSALEEAAFSQEPPLLARATLLLACLEAHPDPPTARRRFGEALAALGDGGDPMLEGQIRGRLAAAAHSWGEHELAVEEARRAVSLQEPDGDLFELGRALNVLAVSSAELGNLDTAVACAARATAIAHQIGNPRLECVAVSLQAAIAQDREDFGRSRELHERALALAISVGDVWLEGIEHLYYGRLLHECRARDEARAHYVNALRTLAGRDLRNEAIARASLGALLAELGELEAAAAELTRAEECGVASGRPLLGELVAIWRGHLDLARARAALAEHDRAEAERLRAEVDARMLAIDSRSEDARIAHRMLRSAADDQHRERGVLRVLDGGARVVTPDGVSVSLGKQRALRLVLGALAARDPSRRPLGVDALFAVGWPGERARPESRRNRVHVALSTLRSLGLRDWIVSSEGGWRIDPLVRVIFEPE